MIRDTTTADKLALLDIVRESGAFDDAALSHVAETLDAHLSGGSEAIWLTAEDPETQEPVGVAYCNPEPVTSGTWNLLMLWTRKDRKGRGMGSALVSSLERQLKDRGVRLLLVETSALPAFDTARVFYERCGFGRVATIPHFFAEHDHKVVYTKLLREPAAKDAQGAGFSSSV